MAKAGYGAGSQQGSSSNSFEYLSASDIERFGYCPLNWWQKYKGAVEKGKELDEGIKRHQAVADDMSTITEKEAVATRSQIGIMWFAIIATLLGINGVGEQKAER